MIILMILLTKIFILTHNCKSNSNKWREQYVLMHSSSYQNNFTQESKTLNWVNNLANFVEFSHTKAKSFTRRTTTTTKYFASACSFKVRLTSWSLLFVLMLIVALCVCYSVCNYDSHMKRLWSYVRVDCIIQMLFELHKLAEEA